MNKLMLVAKREYVKVVRKPTFWISTLALPVLMLVVSLISGFSAKATEDKIKSDAQSAKKIIIVDDSNLINDAVMNNQIVKGSSIEDAKNDVKNEKADAAIYYSKDLLSNKKINVYAKDTGIISISKYDGLAVDLLKQSILLNLNNPEKITAFNNNYKITTEQYKDGKISDSSFEDLIPAIVSLFLYVILISFSTSYLLLSVSEEKENRMIETILSILTPRQLIWGKIIGQIAIIFTQVTFLIVLGSLVIKLTGTNLPIDLGKISVTPVQILAIAFYTLTGFLILANMMVGVASIVPTYKDAQSLSSVFIMLAIIPLYLIMAIVAEPSGIIARVTSYIPFTSSMVLIFRAGLNSLPLVEVIISTITLILYTVLSFFISSKLFELGSLEYTKKFSFSEVLRFFFSGKNHSFTK